MEVFQEGKKRKEFANIFSALGICIDLSLSTEKMAQFGNKPKRCESVGAIVLECLKKGELSGQEARQLRGKLVYTESHVFSRFGSIAVQSIAERANSNCGTRPLDNRLVEDLGWLVGRMSQETPRQLDYKDSRPPVIIFVDGACEGERYETVTVGAVLFDKVDSCIEYFGLHVQGELFNDWQEKGPRQVIGQAEVYPVVLAKMHWRKRLEHRRVMYYINNDSAREALIKTTSSSEHTRNMLVVCCAQEHEMRSFPWYARVPTASNIADDPSRMEFKELETMGADRQYPEQVKSMRTLAQDRKG
ncbi:unnamed protein product [Polarella glacialis]|uniref:Uncharacterized protein n=1 Tax=Polarella glacialis TaxID=89957 RepID=A0A813JJF6_POLGL|nr:unnamed protein product [Polarella glacialis]